MRKHISSTSRLLAAAIAMIFAMALVTPAPTAFAQNAPGASQNSPQVPQPDEGGVNWQGVGYGVGTVLVDVIYVPAKVVYAILGGIVGGGAYALTGGNEQTANTIWRSSLGGDYVVTPDMLAGKEPIHFSGPTDTAPASVSEVQPINPAPPAPAAAPAAAPQTASSPAMTTPSGGSQPMDQGTGPVKGGGNLPDTSIE